MWRLNITLLNNIQFMYVILGLQNHCRRWLQPWNQKTLVSWQESDDKPRQCVEKQRHYFADKGTYSQGYGLPSGHLRLWELDCKDGRTSKNCCLWPVVLEKTTESSLDSKIKSVNLKGDQPWIFTRRTYAEAEAPCVLAIWWKQTTHWKNPRCWERLRTEWEEGIRGWDGWMALLMQWTWTWANSGRWWGTGRPGVLQSMGSQRVGHDWVTEQQQQPVYIMFGELNGYVVITPILICYKIDTKRASICTT